VTVGTEVVGEIGAGLLVLVGIADGDTDADAAATASKLAGLRVFADGAGKMNLSVVEAGGEALVVSQFTLLADVRKGRRPSFTDAAPPDQGERLVEEVARLLREVGVPTATGRFGAHMAVESVNDGPVTIVVDASGGRVL
jgi:D-tyrosyl-tRNA(Tyr) deacylase